MESGRHCRESWRLSGGSVEARALRGNSKDADEATARTPVEPAGDIKGVAA